jgi:hypothetical protein
VPAIFGYRMSTGASRARSFTAGVRGGRVGLGGMQRGPPGLVGLWGSRAAGFTALSGDTVPAAAYLQRMCHVRAVQPSSAWFDVSAPSVGWQRESGIHKEGTVISA